MSLLLIFLFTLLLTLIAGGIVGASFRLLRWRLLIWALFPPCIVLAIALATFNLDALFSLSASQGGAIILGAMGITPFYYAACGIGILSGYFLRKRMAPKADSSHDT